VSSCDWTLFCRYQCLQIPTQLHKFNCNICFCFMRSREHLSAVWVISFVL
jgi:hypothetical protein